MPETPPYAALATGYDAVMAHVDYPAWAAYVQALIRKHRPGARSVVELGCGTGALALALQAHGEAGGYAYRAFDGSEPMLAVAREAAGRAGREIPFAPLHFGDPIPGDPADVVVLVYDGLNYLLELSAVERLLVSVRDALAPGGVAIVDQSTPANSENHVDGFDDEGTTAAFSYVRRSRYDELTRLHTNTFEMTFADGRRASETHVQRAYTLGEVRGAAEAAGLAVVAAYDGFTVEPADETADRVHWVFSRAGG